MRSMTMISGNCKDSELLASQFLGRNATSLNPDWNELFDGDTLGEVTGLINI